MIRFTSSGFCKPYASRLQMMKNNRKSDSGGKEAKTTVQGTQNDLMYPMCTGSSFLVWCLKIINHDFRKNLQKIEVHRVNKDFSSLRHSIEGVNYIDNTLNKISWTVIEWAVGNSRVSVCLLLLCAKGGRCKNEWMNSLWTGFLIEDGVKRKREVTKLDFLLW